MPKAQETRASLPSPRRVAPDRGCQNARHFRGPRFAPANRQVDDESRVARRRRASARHRGRGSSAVRRHQAPHRDRPSEVPEATGRDPRGRSPFRMPDRQNRPGRAPWNDERRRQKRPARQPAWRPKRLENRVDQGLGSPTCITPPICRPLFCSNSE